MVTTSMAYGTAQKDSSKIWGTSAHITLRKSIELLSKALPLGTLTSQELELYQETRERCQGLSRAALSKEVASRWRQGARARQPPGANCVDIETYRVNPKKPLNLLGSAPIHTKLDDIFPTSVGRFGPLQFSIPRSALMLFKEYGPHCLQHRMVKMKKPRGATWSQAPEIARRAVWPATSLQHAKEYLS